jgi:sortase B
VIELDTLNATTRWEVFSAFDTTADFDYIRTDFSSDEDYLGFIRELQGDSVVKTDIALAAQDDILTLSTCAYDYKDERFVVCAWRLK